MNIHANDWRVSLFKAEVLGDHRPMEKTLLEFFLQVARRISGELGLSVAIGRIGLGERLGGDETVGDLRATISGWASWSTEEQGRIRSAQV